MSVGARLVPTPPAWVEEACARTHLLLLDHAQCEKKAASSALALVFAYPEEGARCVALARLAREELRHFEQVARMMERLAVPYERLRPGRYAGGLRAAVRTSEPLRCLDLMLCGAIIEARSCERFRLLAPRLPAPLGAFYAELEQAEARHEGLYWQFALQVAGDEAACDRRLDELLAVEAGLATSADDDFRFHSGPPRGSVASS